MAGPCSGREGAPVAHVLRFGSLARDKTGHLWGRQPFRGGSAQTFLPHVQGVAPGIVISRRDPGCRGLSDC